MKKLLVNIIFSLLLIILPALSYSSSLKAGDPLPDFTLISEKEQVYSSSFRDKVLIITYETKETTEVNKTFKDHILKKYPEQSQTRLVSIAVINCSKYFFPVKNICISRTDKESDRLPITVYSDVDGNMFEDFFIIDNESNIFISDREGIIRYVKTGKMNMQEIEKALDLVESLIQ